ncbi:MAG: hypothetical protein AAGA60_32905 [Cyanobacteria bacterium P01_E01_bin.42]
MLAYWVYFRPTILRYYLYQADTKLYCAGSGRHIFQTLKVKAYSNLYFLSVATSLLLSILFASPISLIVSKMLERALIWKQWCLGIGLGTITSILLAFIFFICLGVTIGVARGVMVGVVIVLALGVSFSIGISTIFSIIDISKLSIQEIFQIGIGTSVGIAVAASMGILIGLLVGGILGIIISLILGFTTAIIENIIFTILNSIDHYSSDFSILAFAAILGIAAMGTYGGAVSIAESFVVASTSSIAISIADENNQLLVLIVALVLTWRIPIYVFQLCLLLFHQLHKVKHPLE